MELEIMSRNCKETDFRRVIFKKRKKKEKQSRYQCLETHGQE